MTNEGDERTQFFIVDRCLSMKLREVMTLEAGICEKAWPALRVRYIQEALPLSSYALSESDDIGSALVEFRFAPAMSTVQRMQQALGSDFVVDAASDRMGYWIGRKYISSEPAPVKPATTRVEQPAPRASKPTAKRVKPGDHMKETPLVQRFSQLDLD